MNKITNVEKKMPSGYTLKNTILAVQAFTYLKEHDTCTIPEVRKSLGIPASKPPNAQEAFLYRLIKTLHKYKLIEKTPIDPMPLAGPKFKVQITTLGKEELGKICDKGGYIVINSSVIKEKIIEFKMWYIPLEMKIH